MTINVQSRAAGGEWQVRNAFLTENAKVKAGSMQRGELLRLATQTMQGWRSYEDGRQLRVYDSENVRQREPEAKALGAAASPSRLHPPHVFFSRIDHQNSFYPGCECQACTPTPRAAADVVLHDGDGLDSEGYSLDEPREWSDEEIARLRRREFACDDYGRDI